MDGAGSRCKIVVVGDTQCGKTALLHVFAKDCYPEVRLSKVCLSFENISLKLLSAVANTFSSIKNLIQSVNV